MELSVLSQDNPCRHCGRCCEHIGTPPGYAMITRYGVPPEESETEDGIRLRTMPQFLRIKLLEYFEAMMAGDRPDRSGYDCPCLWYDPMTQSCRHHEWRPQVCREFEVGSEGCNKFRNECGLAPLE